MSASKKIESKLASWYKKNRSLVLRQTPVWLQVFTGLLISLGSLALFVAFFTKIDEVISVQGKLESDSGRREVESPVGGRVAKMLVTDGDTVTKGQLVLQFDTKEARFEEAALTRNLNLEKESLENKLNLIKEKRMIALRSLNTTTKIVSSLESLVEEGGFQRIQYLEELDKKYRLQSELNAINIEEKNFIVDSTKRTIQMSLRLSKIKYLIDNQNVISPSSGIVFQPQVSTDGVIEAGKLIFSIIPQEGLKASVWVSNKDIGFVKTGLKAQVRVDAFPYTQYGELLGSVTKIGADVMPPDSSIPTYRFPVEISLNRSYLLGLNKQKIPLRSGLAVQANLKLREKRVISLLSDLMVSQSDSVKSIRQ